MFFRLPVVRFFNRVINRATVTVALVLLQIGWLLWAFFSLTAGKVWVNAGLNVLSLFITLYLVRKDENSDYKTQKVPGAHGSPHPAETAADNQQVRRILIALFFHMRLAYWLSASI